MKKKKCIAMLLAGGQGSRLGALTSRIAKPAVSFGGKYRIIDFSLSNCVNSGIDTVGILIQYKPLVLNRYVGTGQSWDLDLTDGGVHILPPYAREEGGNWYEGTADSIYHNIDFIDVYSPENVLILSGDHIYKMDYNRMLEYHESKAADLTVAVYEVPIEEASRFGIMSADADDRITKFAEKPKNPESTLASMGIYIFKWDILKTALLEDHNDENSDHDFGKNIIPKLLGEGKKLYAHHFDGYWKDVGTVDSYYESQMDLMDDDVDFNVFTKVNKIQSNSNMYPPQFIGPDADVTDSMVSNGCAVYGSVKHSILGSGAYVGKDAVVEDSILLPNSRVEDGCRIIRTIVNEGYTVEADTELGAADAAVEVVGTTNLTI